MQDDIPELEEYFLVNLTYVDLIMAPVTSFPPRLGMVFVCFHLFTANEVKLFIFKSDVITIILVNLSYGRKYGELLHLF